MFTFFFYIFTFYFTFQMGQQACSILVEKILNPELPDRHILLNTELIIRESTR